MYKHFFKRFFDVLIALVALLLIGWFLIIVAIWLHFANKGAGAFFFQERPGKDAKIFKVIKFKTMTDERDAEGNLLPDAERLTIVGKFVRSASIDELPQLINIIKGDMSVVGPRPEMIENVDKYTEELPEFSYRLRVKGGLTGYAQIAGKYNTSPKDKLVLDFSGVTFMDSSGLGLVMGRHRLTQAAGIDFEIQNIPPRPMQMFKMAGIERIIKINTGKEEENEKKN